jgi:uncharacterized protein (DUF3084 family)
VKKAIKPTKEIPYSQEERNQIQQALDHLKKEKIDMQKSIIILEEAVHDLQVNLKYFRKKYEDMRKRHGLLDTLVAKSCENCRK